MVAEIAACDVRLESDAQQLAVKRGPKRLVEDSEIEGATLKRLVAEYSYEAEEENVGDDERPNEDPAQRYRARLALVDRDRRDGDTRLAPRLRTRPATTHRAGL